MMLQACLNGDRTSAFHPKVPRTPDELAGDARAVVAAGAAELHVHPRGADGLESLEPGDVAAALAAIRAAVPGVPVGLSTRWEIRPGGAARRQPIARWHVLPDYVSINLVEEDAPDMIRLVRGMGVGVEAGLWSVADAERFVRLPEASACLRVLIEINEQDAAEGIAVADGVRAVLRDAGLVLPILLHGYDATVWPLYRRSRQLGLDGRIGFEDGALLPTGATAADNAELIEAARRWG